MIRFSQYGLFLLIIILSYGCAHSAKTTSAIDTFYIDKAFVDLHNAIEDGAAPGGVGLVLIDGQIAAHRAVGSKQSHLIFRSSETGEIKYLPLKTPMTKDTIFDLASVTKVVATTTAVMKLVEEGKIDLDKSYASYIPSFAQHGKDKITVRQIFTHTSGLPAWFAFYENYINREEVYQSIDENIELAHEPNTKRLYSDLGFILLGRLVEEVSGQRLDHYTRDHIFEPLGMDDTGYLPHLSKRLRVAPTEYDAMRDQTLRGIVHDENTRTMGGVSGHAGLFSTASDLAIFAQMMLNGGEYNSVRILKPETIETMNTWQVCKKVIDNGNRFLRHRNQNLGWWGMDSKMTIDNTGGLPSSTAYGHNGFTGTSIWIDPEHNAAVILLTNAVHPRRADADKSRLYQEFHAAVSKAIVGPDQVNIDED